MLLQTFWSIPAICLLSTKAASCTSPIAIYEICFVVLRHQVCRCVLLTVCDQPKVLHSQAIYEAA